MDCDGGMQNTVKHQTAFKHPKALRHAPKESFICNLPDLQLVS